MAERSKRWTIFVTIAFVVLLIGAHVGLHRLEYDFRPYVFGAVSIVYLVWPLLCWVVPKWFLLPMMLVPLFGIWLGVFYVGMEGEDKYFLEATPPCCTGVWAIAASAEIVYRRLK